MKGCVYLVGAGCGKADLITVRGLSLLQACDTVVYDDLIAQDILCAVPKSAEKIYAGKRSGKHSASQEEICALLIRKAQEGKCVIRLKGGDPFIFGRGGEEILALQAAGIPCEEVPGISSAIAIPASVGIPVTYRGVSRSVHIITAHTADTSDGLPTEFDKFAALPGTLLFLMGLSKIEQISKRLIAAGKEADTPAAVISGCNFAHPAAIRGTLADIAKKTREANVQPPAVIVVGETAVFNLSSTIKKPLDGLRVGLTGTQTIAEKLRAALEHQGADVFLAEKSVVDELPFSFDCNSLCSDHFKWIAFTSSNGVRIFFEHLSKQRVDLRRLNTCRFAVIGASTEKTLAQYGVYADICPEVYTSEGLADALLNAAKDDEPIYLFRSRRASRELVKALRNKHIVYDIPIYDLQPDLSVLEYAQKMLPQTDYLTFCSASGVELFFDSYKNIPDGTTCVCIGDVTAKALRMRYDKAFLTASNISADGILMEICRNESVRKHTIENGSVFLAENTVS